MMQTMHQHRSGLYLPFNEKRKPIAIDLFCGAGGFSLGFLQAGFEVIAGLDFDYYCMLTYLTNLGKYPCQIHFIDPNDEEKINAKMERDMKKEAKKNGEIMRPLLAGNGWIKHHPECVGVSHFFYGDVQKITGQEMLDIMGLKPGEVDCVFGGPPCQGFSIAGKRDVMDPRNSLVFEYGKKILEIQPKTFVMENVKGIASMVTPEGLPVVDALSLMLSEGGYGAYEALKKTLLSTSGAGAAIKDQEKTSGKTAKGTERAKEQPIQQTALF